MGVPHILTSKMIKRDGVKCVTDKISQYESLLRYYKNFLKPHPFGFMTPKMSFYFSVPSFVYTLYFLAYELWPTPS